MVRRMRSRVSARTGPFSFTTRETVATETRARRATSLIVTLIAAAPTASVSAPSRRPNVIVYIRLLLTVVKPLLRRCEEGGERLERPDRIGDRSPMIRIRQRSRSRGHVALEVRALCGGRDDARDARVGQDPLEEQLGPALAAELRGRGRKRPGGHAPQDVASAERAVHDHRETAVGRERKNFV